MDVDGVPGAVQLSMGGRDAPCPGRRRKGSLRVLCLSVPGHPWCRDGAGSTGRGEVESSHPLLTVCLQVQLTEQPASSPT